MKDQKLDLNRTGSAVYYLGRRETTAERVRRLQAEARIMAREHIEELEKCLLRTAEVAREVAEGGEAYPVGVREPPQRSAEADTTDRAHQGTSPIEPVAVNHCDVCPNAGVLGNVPIKVIAYFDREVCNRYHF